jgi:hypothetical protein
MSAVAGNGYLAVLRGNNFRRLRPDSQFCARTIPAVFLNGEQAGIVTDGNYGNPTSYMSIPSGL